MRPTDKALAPLLLLLFVSFTAGCGHDPKGRERFANAPIVWKVDDRHDVARKPDERAFDHVAYVFENTAYRPIDDVLAVRLVPRATNINALGGVPDSTWFTNRIGTKDMTVEQMRIGPNADIGPDHSAPWTIVSGKQGGAAVGFLIEDARGDRFLLKFDSGATPEMESAANVVVQRLLWAVGYNVPQDSVEYFHRDQLVVGAEATARSKTGDKVRLTEAAIDRELEGTHRDAQGRFRGLASRFLSGEPLGGYPQMGTRPDDPNDLVPHELRRDLRGLYVFAAWLAHTDMKEDNTVDMWIEDPRDRSRHYVQHHLVDFGKALGVMPWTSKSLRDGWAYNFDYAYTFGSMLALGFWKRPWEDRARPPIAGVGVFDSHNFDPGRFRSRNRFFPFAHKDRFDAYWATKILMRLSPELIGAAVEQGRYSEPAAVEYLTRTLVERQRKTGRYWFSKVNPLDAFDVTPDEGGYRVCARDLLLAYGLDADAVASSTYEMRAYDYAGRRRRWARQVAARADGRVCARGLTPSRSSQGQPDGYTIVGLFTTRGDDRLDPVWLHLAQDPETGGLRVIGVDRE